MKFWPHYQQLFSRSPIFCVTVPYFFDSFLCDRYLEHRSILGQLDQNCRFMSHFYPHVGLQIAWILDDLNKKTEFYHTVNFGFGSMFFRDRYLKTKNCGQFDQICHIMGYLYPHIGFEVLYRFNEKTVLCHTEDMCFGPIIFRWFFCNRSLKINLVLSERTPLMLYYKSFVSWWRAPQCPSSAQVFWKDILQSHTSSWLQSFIFCFFSGRKIQNRAFFNNFKNDCHIIGRLFPQLKLEGAQYETWFKLKLLVVTF